jgi:hypothetical protein
MAVFLRPRKRQAIAGRGTQAQQGNRSGRGAQATRCRLSSKLQLAISQRHHGRASAPNRVTEVAGLSIDSIYQYFPIKAALIAALIAREQGLYVEAVARIMEKNPTQTLGNLCESAKLPAVHRCAAKIERPSLLILRSLKNPREIYSEIPYRSAKAY